MELKSGISSINERFSNQRDKILEHINRFGSISPKEALKHYGCMRLAAQILILKENGWKIVTTMQQRGDVTWAEYLLEERFEREHKQASDFNLANSGEGMPVPKAYFKHQRNHYESKSNDPYEWAEEGH